MKRYSKEQRARFLSLVPRERIRSNGHKQKYNTFPMNIRKNYFYSKANQALEEAAQRGCGVLVPEGLKPDWTQA